VSVERFDVSEIISYNVHTNILTVKLGFVTPEKQKVIEELTIEKKGFGMMITKPFRQMKTYLQLKKLFALYKQVLLKLEIYPTAEVMKAMDDSFKDRCFPPNIIGVGGQQIPVRKSKADMTIEELSYMIQTFIDDYEELLKNE